MLPLDYSRCSNEKCPLKNKCLRYLDKNSKYLWYSNFKFEKNKCDDFIKDVKKDKNSIR